MKIFLKSNFFIPVTVISTYVLLTVVPSVGYTVYWASDSALSSAWTNFYQYHQISIRISHTIDALLYIFLQKKVRRLLYKKLTFQCNTTKLENIFCTKRVLHRIIGTTQQQDDMEVAEMRKDEAENVGRETRCGTNLLVLVVSNCNENDACSTHNELEIENMMPPIVDSVEILL